jgi:hypothetical protein
VEERISVGSVHSVLHKDMDVHYFCQHLVSNMLTHEQKKM